MSGAPFTVAVLFFDDVEELDAVGPWEVLRFWATLTERAVDVVGVAPRAGSVRCSKGLSVRVGERLDAVRPDLLVHPGGRGTTALAGDETHLGLLRANAARGTVLASVCTGARVLGAAGLLDGHRATTHWRAVEELRAAHPAADVLDGVRWIDDGQIVTSAGVSAGLDMALHLVDRFESAAMAARVARAMEYPW